MRSQQIRMSDLIVGFTAVLGMAAIVAGAPLSDRQINRQSERAESDRAIAEQIGKNIRRVSIPGPLGSHAGRDIERALYGHTSNSFYGIFDYVDVWIDDGIVTLTGYVTHEYKVDGIANLVSRVQGVREIQNQIEVLPVSGFDDQLRAHIARRIYGDVLMPHVRLAAPLHIIVDNLHVTLAGTVFSEVEKQRAEHVARHTFSVLTLQNDLEVAGKARALPAKVGETFSSSESHVQGGEVQGS